MTDGSGGSAQGQLAEHCYVLRAAAKTGDGTRELFVAIYQPAVEKVPEFNAQGIANAL